MIGRWILCGITAWCVLIGIWDHDWRLILAGVALGCIWPLISDDVHEVAQLDGDDDLAESA